MSKLLNVDDIAERINLSPRTVAKLLTARVMPVVKLGRRILVREEDLVAYVDAHLLEPAGARAERRKGSVA